MNIGWPEGIWIGLSLIGLAAAAYNNGRPRPEQEQTYNFAHALMRTVILTAIVWWGGFFA